MTHPSVPPMDSIPALTREHACTISRAASSLFSASSSARVRGGPILAASVTSLLGLSLQSELKNLIRSDV
eukprot:14127781-Heterocapsa_arctica.AAC.1